MSTEDQQVQVQLAWTPAGALLSTERSLQRLERDEQRQCATFRIVHLQHDIQTHDRVVEVSLVDDPDGTRRIEPRDAREATAG